MALTRLESLKQLRELVGGRAPVVVVLGPRWCLRCRLQEQAAERAIEAASVPLRAAAVNPDDVPEAMEALGAATYPTVVLYSDGRPVWRSDGFASEELLREAIDAHLQPDAYP